MSCEPPSAVGSDAHADEWTIVHGGFDVDCFRAAEGLFTLGSGYLHARGSLEEHLAGAPQNAAYTRRPANVTSEPFAPLKSKWGTYVPGVYGPHPLLNNELINLPWFLGLAPVVAGERLDLECGRIEHTTRALDLRTATLRRTVAWRTRGGARVECVFERFISAARPRLSVQRLALRSDRVVDALVIAGIDADVRTNGYDHFTRVALSASDDGDLECAVATDAGDEVRIRSRVALSAAAAGRAGGASRRAADGEPRDGAGSEAAGGAACVERAARRIERALSFRLTPDSPVVVEKRTAVATSRDLHHCAPAAALADAEPLSYEALHAEHAAVWGQRWDGCDVVVAGDAEAQRALRVALFHLLRCHVPGDARVAIDAKGYAGEAYWGRFFWDTELFLLPFFLYTAPDNARTLADFRVQSLAGARENARRYGYAGARYAWESDSAGRECCPNWQYADHEVHVTADVAYGLVHFARATGDEGYLRGEAARVLVETARYWMARVDWRDATITDCGLPRADSRAAATTRRPSEADRDATGGNAVDPEADPRALSAVHDPHSASSAPGSAIHNPRLAAPVLLGVMGPNEYTPISNNNAYTNRLVAFALDAAARWGAAAGASREERAAFERVARGLPIPRAADGVLVLQCDGFDGLADPHFEQLWHDRTRTYAEQVSQERLYRSRVLKQADVLMLMTLFPDEYTDAEVRRAWEYYVPLTTHDSSLSAGVHAMVATRLGLHGDAWRFWQRSCAIDLDLAGGGAAEGIHIANAGAVWQMAVFGFAGVRTALQADELTISPRLPEAWTRLAFPLIWKRTPVAIDIRRASAPASAAAPGSAAGAPAFDVSVENRGAATLPVVIDGARHEVAAGATQRWPCVRAAASAAPATIRG
ncbi:MAG: glycosyl hydrolase family 65 protein [Phycisphaerae bacterium]